MAIDAANPLPHSSILPRFTIRGEDEAAAQARNRSLSLSDHIAGAFGQPIPANVEEMGALEQSYHDINTRYFNRHTTYLTQLKNAMTAMSSEQAVHSAVVMADAVTEWCKKVEQDKFDQEIPVLNNRQRNIIISEGRELCLRQLPEVLRKLPPEATLQAAKIEAALKRVEELRPLPTCTLYARNSNGIGAASPASNGTLTAGKSTMSTTAKTRGAFDRYLMPTLVIGSGLTLLGIMIMYLRNRSDSKASQKLQNAQRLQGQPGLQGPPLQRPYPQQYAPYRPMPAYNQGYGGYPMITPYNQQVLGGYAGGYPGAMGYGYGNPYSPLNNPLNMAQYAG